MRDALEASVWIKVPCHTHIGKSHVSHMNESCPGTYARCNSGERVDQSATSHTSLKESCRTSK